MTGPTENIGIGGVKTVQAGTRTAPQGPLNIAPCQQLRAAKASTSGANLVRIGVQMLHQARIEVQVRGQSSEIFALGCATRVDGE